MLSKNKIKYIQSLRLKKNRQKHKAFVVEGAKIVAELLQDKKIKTEFVVATATWIKTHPHAALLLGDALISVSEGDLKKISNLNTPNQVVAIASLPEWIPEAAIIENDISLYLDGIQDPGNLGTILRIADWFGIRHVFASPTSADLFNPKVIQSTMGAFLRVQYHRIAFQDLRNRYPEIPCFGAVLDGDNLYEIPMPQKGFLIIGNESQGISSEVQTLLNQRIAIPANTPNGAESLNAAVATGIICAFLRKG